MSDTPLNRRTALHQYLSDDPRYQLHNFAADCGVSVRALRDSLEHAASDTQLDNRDLAGRLRFIVTEARACDARRRRQGPRQGQN